MKKLIGLIFFFSVSNLFALTQTQQEYKNERNIKQEFRNLYMNVQSKQYTIFTTTPNLNDLQDGQIVILSSFTKGFAWRDGNTINMINSSGAMTQFNYVTQTSNTYISNGVTHITPGTNITINPAGGTGDVTVNADIGAYVASIIAGTGIGISGGTGNVTINVTLNLSDLLDTNVAGVTDGQCLKWNTASGKWIPGTCGGAVATTKLLLEDGTALLLEDGTNLLTE
jgi:hypothetical protein